ncbi:hypothetical protein K469DRAFT_719740 [Zopfia rhizophila CBS 207.26]|uniref:Uncharacterized protein n=1 Tax=Zopfia rhizophila CBS 207.26 TaxID=1314779 RepID=A0A6A6DHV8_9PEZI|nr:hypothetical protein K469DRAFT_719740 [Zopfia rhizophila CBS 207.26]
MPNHVRAKNVPEKPRTRKGFERVESDSAPFLVHRDSTPLFSQWSDILSNLSTVFAFHRELFVSNVYNRVLRRSHKEALRRQQGRTEQGDDEYRAKRRSHAIDCYLEEESRKPRRECAILLFDCDEFGKKEIVKHMKITYGSGYTAEELAIYRPIIYEYVIDCAKALIATMEQFEIVKSSSKISII